MSLQNFFAAYLQAWNAHDLENLLTFYHPEYEGLDVGQARPIHGREGAGRVIAVVLNAFPDLELSAGAPLIQEPRLAVEWSMRGTHRGRVMNIPPTLRPVQVRGISIFGMESGLISRASHVWDVAGLLRALGLLPDL